MKTYLLTLVPFFFADSVNGQEIVYDIEGNSYEAVTIGTQVWLNSNLKSAHFSNGDSIPTSPDPWQNITGESFPFYQWAYDDKDSLVQIYGRLYTYYVIIDERNICPAGWHVPSITEFKILEDFLGGTVVAGGKLKEAGYDHWFAPNVGATNEVGYNGLPNGHRNLLGEFNEMGVVSDVWTVTPGIQGGLDFDINYNTAATSSYDDFVGFGAAVRCLRDSLATTDLEKILVYPVPANSLLTIDCKEMNQVFFELRSITGSLIDFGYLQAGLNEMNISDFTPAVYILKITLLDQTRMYKIVKV